MESKPPQYLPTTEDSLEYPSYMVKESANLEFNQDYIPISIITLSPKKILESSVKNMECSLGT